ADALAELRVHDVAHVGKGHGRHVSGNVGELGADRTSGQRAAVVGDQTGAQTGHHDDCGSNQEVAGVRRHVVKTSENNTARGGNSSPPGLIIAPNGLNQCSSTYSRRLTALAASTSPTPVTTASPVRLWTMPGGSRNNTCSIASGLSAGMAWGTSPCR